ncbi:MAG: CsbD family protein [Terracidiphilus sp.]|jgi:uncharacterized protein YjbJ (UPF0337 family)
MNKDRVKGIFDELAGGARRTAGELTDNPELQAKGALQQLKGKLEGTWGQAKQVVQDAIKDSDVHFDANVTLKTKNSTANAECKKMK